MDLIWITALALVPACMMVSLRLTPQPQKARARVRR